MYSYLGISLDPTMTFVPHIDIISKATKVLNEIKCISYSLVQPSLEYAI